MDVNQSTDVIFDNKAIHTSIERNRIDMAKLLISTGKVDINARNKKGEAPLHIVANYHSRSDRDTAKMAKLLVQNGALINVRNHKGWTPKQALLNWNPEQLPIFKAAVAAGLETIAHNKQMLTYTLQYVSVLADLPDLPNELISMIVDNAGGFGKKLDSRNVAVLRALTIKKRKALESRFEEEKDSVTNKVLMQGDSKERLDNIISVRIWNKVSSFCAMALLGIPGLILGQATGWYSASFIIPGIVLLGGYLSDIVSKPITVLCHKVEGVIDKVVSYSLVEHPRVVGVCSSR